HVCALKPSAWNECSAPMKTRWTTTFRKRRAAAEDRRTARPGGDEGVRVLQPEVRSSQWLAGTAGEHRAVVSRGDGRPRDSGERRRRGQLHGAVVHAGDERACGGHAAELPADLGAGA